MKIRILLTGMCAAAILTASLAGCSVSVTTTETTKEPDQVSQTESSSKQNDATAEKDEYFYLSQGEVDSPEWFTKLDAAKDCDQMIVVAGVGETTAYVTMHEKDENGKWKMILSTPGYTGLSPLTSRSVWLMTRAVKWSIPSVMTAITGPQTPVRECSSTGLSKLKIIPTLM